MAIRRKFQVRINEDKTIDRPAHMFDQIIEAFHRDDRPVYCEISIKRVSEKSRQQAHGYYRAVVVVEALRGFVDMGHELDENIPSHLEAVHSFLKNRFLPPKDDHVIFTFDDQTERTDVSMAGRSKEEVGQYIEKCVRFIAMYLNRTVPPPTGDYWKQLANHMRERYG